MARYIDAEKLCKDLKEMASVQYPDKQNTILGVISTIENAPTVDVVEVRHGEMKTCNTCKCNKVCDYDKWGFESCDNYISDEAVEVVRCKDCIHWGGVTYGFVCRKFSGIDTKICMGADHFCSYGTPKERGGEK